MELLKSDYTVSFDQANLETKGKDLESENAIVHFITTPTLDRVRDIMNPKGGILTDFEKTRTVFFNHDYYIPIGKNLWSKSTNDGIKVKTQFSKTEFAQDVYTWHKEGVINSWSIGFTVPRDKNGNIEKDAIEYDESKDVRTFNKWVLLEYSSTGVPCNPDAVDQAKGFIKSFAGESYIKSIETELEYIKRFKEYDNKFLEMKTLIDAIQFDPAKITEIEADIKNIQTELTNRVQPKNVENAAKVIKEAFGEAFSETTGRKFKLK
jgi:HK97 family phage prohead protease